MAVKSPLFSNAGIHLIPFGLDLIKFKPADSRDAKRKLGIPEDNIVLCFRAQKSKFKGLNYIKECLADLTVPGKKVTLLTFAEKDLMSEFAGKFQIIDMGWVLDEAGMIEAYNAADIFLMPSSADAFGMMAMEAMACGKPVIVMSGTALEEVVFPDAMAGVVVPQGDVKAFLSATMELITDEAKRLTIGRNALKIAAEHYSLERYITQIIDVYQMAIDRKKSDTRAAYLVDESKKVSISIEKNILHTSNIYMLKEKLIKNRTIKFFYYQAAGLFSRIFKKQ